MTNALVKPPSQEVFMKSISNVEAFKNNWYKFYKKISKEKTPDVDGQGVKIIREKGGFDYIIEAYMREQLNKHFPGWSWRRTSPPFFLGTE